MVLYVIVGVVALVPLFFLWSFIHELAHFRMLKRFQPEATAKYRIYPHVHERLGFVFASVTWENLQRPLEGSNRAWVSIAPRIPDTIGACLALGCAWTLSGWPAYVLTFLFGGSLLDMGYGSIGYNETSDLRRAAKGWGINPWVLRLAGWGFAVGVATGIVVGLL